MPVVGFVGATNAGKSSLVNALYNTNCPTSAAECTMGVHKVCQFQNKYQVVDIFGYNDSRPYYSKDEIDTVLEMKVAVFCFETNIKTCARAIKLLNSAGVYVIAVRTKADHLNMADRDLVTKESRGELAGYGTDDVKGQNVFVMVSKDEPRTLEVLLAGIDVMVKKSYIR